jgi:hypothetical protein
MPGGLKPKALRERKQSLWETTCVHIYGAIQAGFQGILLPATAVSLRLRKRRGPGSGTAAFPDYPGTEELAGSKGKYFPLKADD